MAKHVEVDPALWEEFHRVVNMTSRELMDWLRTRSAGEEADSSPTRRVRKPVATSSRYCGSGASI